jgi:hypothetical protein
MSSKYVGGFITKSPTAPTTSAAKGIWTLDQAANYRKQGIWPATPGAPTIGTATAGVVSATVAYTAPTNLGAGTVTYTATSSPGGLTGTGASPITVSGLTASTSYTFTVTASTSGGTSPASAASNSVTPTAPLVIGQALGGGFFAGQISTAGNGIADYNLVIGPVASAQTTNKQWKTSATTTSGTSSAINGPANSAAMNNASHPAAEFCEGLTVGGFSDWYSPAKNELEICYYNLKPGTASNATNSGTNINAVPSRGSNYTSGTPAQTTAAAFVITTGAESFTFVDYWTSTEASATGAWAAGFYSGQQNSGNKTYGYRSRAIRRVAV